MKKIYIHIYAYVYIYVPARRASSRAFDALMFRICSDAAHMVCVVHIRCIQGECVQGECGVYTG